MFRRLLHFYPYQLNETYDATSKAAGNLNSTYNLNATYEKAKVRPCVVLCFGMILICHS